MDLPVKVVLDGDSQFTNFSVLDKSATTQLMRWRTLDIAGIGFVNEPLRVNVDSVAIADFFAYVVNHSTRRTQPQTYGAAGGKKASPSPVTSPAARSETSEQVPATPVKNVAESMNVTPAMKSIPVRIGRISLQGGNVNFHDQFIKPNYRANLTGLAGRVGPLDPEKPGIDIRGAVDKTAPLKISGDDQHLRKRAVSGYHRDSERH